MLTARYVHKRTAFGQKIGPTNALPEYDLPSEFFIPFFQELFSFSVLNVA